MSFTVTEQAAKFIRRMVRLNGGAGGFYLAVRPGGCAGLSAEFGVEPAPRTGSEAREQDGMTLYLDAESRILLEGVTIDFVDTAHETGFRFYDPKATGTCGSHSAATH